MATTETVAPGAGREPAFGAILIDEKPATSVRFQRLEREGEPAFELSFHMGRKQVARLKDVDRSALVDAVGERNAASIEGASDPKGTLSGENLRYEYGLSPEEAQRRVADKEERKAAESKQMTADSFVEKMAAAHPIAGGVEANTIDRGPERARKAGEVDVSEALDDARKLRDADRRALNLNRESLLNAAETEEKNVRELNVQGQSLDQSNDLAERAGDPSQDDRQEALELDKNRRIQMMQQLHEEYRVDKGAFHFKERNGERGKVAFRDSDTRLKTMYNDPRVARSMAAAAYAKGWTTLHVKGHEDFRREVWQEASMLGLNVKGYEPTREEQANLDAALERQRGNTVERVPDARSRAAEAPARVNEGSEAGNPAPAAPERKHTPAVDRAFVGLLVEHGAAPFNHVKDEKQSYFVKLATQDGVRTIWGKDLARAVGDSGVKTGDTVRLDHRGDKPVTVDAVKRDEHGKKIGTEEISTKRNAWEMKLTERGQVVEAIAAAVVKNKIKDPEDRKTVMALMEKRIAEKDRAGTLPAARMFDQKANPQRDSERGRPAVERNAERTR